jgi:hypothetical protein
MATIRKNATTLPRESVDKIIRNIDITPTIFNPFFFENRKNGNMTFITMARSFGFQLNPVAVCEKRFCNLTGRSGVNAVFLPKYSTYFEYGETGNLNILNDSSRDKIISIRNKIVMTLNIRLRLSKVTA